MWTIDFQSLFFWVLDFRFLKNMLFCMVLTINFSIYSSYLKVFGKEVLRTCFSFTVPITKKMYLPLKLFPHQIGPNWSNQLGGTTVTCLLKTVQNFFCTVLRGASSKLYETFSVHFWGGGGPPQNFTKLQVGPKYQRDPGWWSPILLHHLSYTTDTILPDLGTAFGHHHRVRWP